MDASVARYIIVIVAASDVDVKVVAVLACVAIVAGSSAEGMTSDAMRA